jgi:DNA-binding XRE family transcriptional regulator
MNKLREYLQTNGIKQKSFAKQIGACESTLCNITKNNQIPTLKLAIEIEKATRNMEFPENQVTVYDWFSSSDQNQRCEKTHTKKKE